MKIKTLLLIIFILTCSSTVSPAQKKNRKPVVSGYVTDNNGRSISGALIIIDKEYSDVRTNRDGFYKIRISSDAETISVLTLDNQTGIEKIEGRTSIDFKLDETSVSQDIRQPSPQPENMVDIGYGSVDSRDLTMPVNKLDASEGKYSAYKDIYEILNTIPGVEVSGNSIRIRGAVSFYASTEPHYIVNGMPVSSIDHIAPYEVESITVLKGPSAAIYGVHGANGVIIIALKKGNQRNR